MSQNTTGHDPNNPNDDGRAYGAGPVDPAVSSNPYYGQGPAAATPDLDAAAPSLRSSEEQRLNRKALLFLGGILLLMIGLGFLVFRKSSTDKDAVVKTPTRARVSTPELPSTLPEAVPAPTQAAEPIALMPTPPLPEQQPQGGRYNGPQDTREIDRGPTLVERRIGSAGGSGRGQDGGGGGSQSGVAQANDDYAKAMMAMIPGAQQQAPQKQRRGPDVDDVSSARFISKPDGLLVRGTYLRCILETRIITDVPGFTSCLVTESVYSINGHTLLLPKGSKIYGSYGGGPTADRVAVVWDRITTPNGIDVSMSSPGIDNMGGAGHPGQYTAHWASRVTSALLISLMSDAFKYAAAQNGPETTTISSGGFAVQSPYESATARSMERLADQALQEGARRQPTVTINQGTVVSIYVAKDVDFTNVLPQQQRR